MEASVLIYILAIQNVYLSLLEALFEFLGNHRTKKLESCYIP